MKKFKHKQCRYVAHTSSARTSTSPLTSGGDSATTTTTATTESDPSSSSAATQQRYDVVTDATLSALSTSTRFADDADAVPASASTLASVKASASAAKARKKAKHKKLASSLSELAPNGGAHGAAAGDARHSSSSSTAPLSANGDATATQKAKKKTAKAATAKKKKGSARKAAASPKTTTTAAAAAAAAASATTAAPPLTAADFFPRHPSRESSVSSLKRRAAADDERDLPNYIEVFGDDVELEPPPKAPAAAAVVAADDELTAYATSFVDHTRRRSSAEPTEGVPVHEATRGARPTRRAPPYPTTSPISASMTACARDWNAEFQYLQSSSGPMSFFLNAASTSQLGQEFLETATIYGKIIISELGMSPAHKTIKPIAMGGVAGGDKYVHHGILFKFALDTIVSRSHEDVLWLYGGAAANDEKAIKAAGRELLGRDRFWGAFVDNLCLPLMTMIEFKGFRLIAMPVLPISPATIRYGSADGGRSVHADVPALNELMKTAGERLNLAGHVVSSNGVTIYGPGDIEAHVGTDGRYYVLDFARLFPPEAPAPRSSPAYDARAVFYRLLRPEFVRAYCKPLCADAFTRWDYDTDAAKRNIDAVREATRYLYEHVIPEFAQQLEYEFEEMRMERLSPCYYGDDDDDEDDDDDGVASGSGSARGAAGGAIRGSRGLPARLRHSVSMLSGAGGGDLFASGSRQTADDSVTGQTASGDQSSHKRTRKIFENLSRLMRFVSSTKLHQAGINVRHLGRVRALVKNDALRELIMSCMVARVMRRQLCAAFRRLMAEVKVPSDEPFKKYAADYMNRVFGTLQGSNDEEEEAAWAAERDASGDEAAAADDDDGDDDDDDGGGGMSNGVPVRFLSGSSGRGGDAAASVTSRSERWASVPSTSGIVFWRHRLRGELQRRFEHALDEDELEADYDLRIAVCPKTTLAFFGQFMHMQLSDKCFSDVIKDVGGAAPRFSSLDIVDLGTRARMGQQWHMQQGVSAYVVSFVCEAQRQKKSMKRLLAHARKEFLEAFRMSTEGGMSAMFVAICTTRVATLKKKRPSQLAVWQDAMRWWDRTLTIWPIRSIMRMAAVGYAVWGKHLRDVAAAEEEAAAAGASGEEEEEDDDDDDDEAAAAAAEGRRARAATATTAATTRVHAVSTTAQIAAWRAQADEFLEEAKALVARAQEPATRTAQKESVNRFFDIIEFSFALDLDDALRVDVLGTMPLTDEQRRRLQRLNSSATTAHEIFSAWRKILQF